MGIQSREMHSGKGRKNGVTLSKNLTLNIPLEKHGDPNRIANRIEASSSAQFYKSLNSFTLNFLNLVAHEQSIGFPNFLLIHTITLAEIPKLFAS